jgi:isopentenyl-diphosphate delta-isomerase
MNDALERVILVDSDDRPLGTAPKLDAHVNGQLHRAFSVLVHDGADNLLLHKRARGKYHSGGLWTNACCGHPRAGEETVVAARRRLFEEMGVDCALMPLQTLIYRAEVGGGLVEHELVHLFTACWRGAVEPDPAEAEAHRWQQLQAVRRAALATPERFTPWFRLYLTLDLGELGMDGQDIAAADHM